MLGWTASSTRTTGNWPGMELETLRTATIVRSLQNWCSNESGSLPLIWLRLEGSLVSAALSQARGMRLFGNLFLHHS